MCRHQRLSLLAAAVLCCPGVALANGSMQYETLEGSSCRVTNGPQPELSITVGGNHSLSEGENHNWSSTDGSSGQGSATNVNWDQSFSAAEAWGGNRNRSSGFSGQVGLRIPLGGDRTREARLNCENLGKADQKRLHWAWMVEQVEAGRVKRSSLEALAAEMGLELTDEGASTPNGWELHIK